MNTHSRWVPSRMPLTVCKSGAVVLNGVCTKIDFPGGTSTCANGNNGRGDIVGPVHRLRRRGPCFSAEKMRISTFSVSNVRRLPFGFTEG